MKKINFKAIILMFILAISVSGILPVSTFAEGNETDIETGLVETEEKTYKIEYEFYGGTPHEDTIYEFVYSTYGVNLEYPTKTGYTFIGWYLDETFNERINYIDTTSKKDYKVYAKWKENTYTIVFLDNIVGYQNQKTYKYTDKVVLSNPFKLNNYKLIGWNTKKDGTGKFYKVNEVVSKFSEADNSSINLYGVWEFLGYSVTYNLNGGVNNTSNPTKYTKITKDIKLKNPTKIGYTFSGWYSDAKYKKKVTSIKKGSKSNITLYAKWTPITYTIKFNKNGGTGTTSSMTNKKYDTVYILSNNKFKRKGYTFIGWNTRSDGKGTNYTNKQSIKNLTTKNKGTITLYAQWKMDTYTITYNLNGGNKVTNPTTYNVTQTINLNKPTKTGYIFGGWYSDSKLKKKVTKITKGSTGNKTLYAKWTPITYTIKFDGNGANSGKMSSLTKRKYDTSYTLTSNSFKKNGYTFVGWNTKKDGTGITYKDKQSVKNLIKTNGATLTLYAQWLDSKIDNAAIKKS